ncbi:MFS transporter [Mycolicibacterium goodii]
MTAPNKHASPDMSRYDTTTSAADASPRKMRKVAFASFMGTVIEFYDFGIYGTAAALVFARAFFPALGEGAGTVVSFATLGVAFVARPVGSILFGHFGDRLGRKRTLIATMSLMGVATVLIGLLPTAAAIGILAPILLIVLRIAQGIAAGGEWAGAILFTAENAPKKTRGFWASFTNVGGAVANILALATFLLTSIVMTDEQFTAWGWRIPFLISIALVALGLYVRLTLDETPVFKDEVRTGGRSALPFRDALSNQWREVLMGAGSLVSAFAFGYVGIAYLTNYGTATLDLSYTAVLGAGIFGNLVNGLFMIMAAVISDRIGRRKVLLATSVAGIPWALALFPILDLQSVPLFWLGMAVTFVIAGMGFGIAGSFLSELFHTRYRYTAAGLAYSAAAIAGGAVPPIVAASIIGKFGSLSFGILLAIYCLVSVLCTLRVRETRDTELTDDPTNARENPCR